jgi:small conductance mechanosensitive channel
MSVQEITEGIVQKIAGWGDQLALMLPNIVAAILVLGVFWLAARIVCSASDRALGRFDANEAAHGLMSRLLRLAVLLAGVMVALGVLNLDKALASVLAGAGVLGLALGFAFQDLAGNLVSGVGLAVHRKWPKSTLDFGIRGGRRLSEALPKLPVAVDERTGLGLQKEAS